MILIETFLFMTAVFIKNVTKIIYLRQIDV